MIKGQSTIASPLIGTLSVLIGLVSGCLLTLIVTANYALDRVADISAQREQQQMAHAMSGLTDELRKQLGAVTYWDESVQHTVFMPNAAWLHHHVGAWLMVNYAIDDVYIVDHNRKLIYAGRDGKIDQSNQWQNIAPLAAPLIRAAQQKLASAGRIVTGGAITTARGPDAADIALLNGEPVLLVAGAVVPDTGRFSIPVDSTATLVAVKRLNPAWLNQFARQVLIRQARFLPALTGTKAGDEGLTMLPLKNNRGERLGLLAWQAWQPLRAFARSVMVPTIAALVVLLVGSVIVAMLVRRSRNEFVSTRHAALHDELTGLPNRRQMSQLLESFIDGKVIAMFIDLDRFKEVNDIWGHDAGDEILGVMARRLQGVAVNAHITRFGGDEFVMLLAGADLGDAEDMAMAILAMLRKPHVINGAQIVLGGSIGIAHNFDGGIGAEELLRRADLALYEAKALGRNCFVTFESDMDVRLQSRRRLEDALARAIAAEQISTVYQPIVDARHGKVVGVEALARWCHAEMGEISPSEFVSVAEEAGLIQGLGRLILQRACMDAARWPGLRISVNVSPAQLRAPGLVDEVGLVLQQAGIAPERLTLEITENALMADRALATRMLSQLHQMGVRMALDDFGTGHSSLAYLRDFRFDFLKIDHHFVDGLARGEYEVLASIIALGHALNLDVVAEGIETREQHDLLRAAGCDGFQGYYFGKPMAAADIDALVTNADVPVVDNSRPGEQERNG